MAHTNVWGKDGLPTSIRKVVHSSDQDSLAVYDRCTLDLRSMEHPRSGARNFGPASRFPAGDLDHTLDNEPRFSRRLEIHWDNTIGTMPRSGAGYAVLLMIHRCNPSSDLQSRTLRVYVARFEKFDIPSC
ncbi:hypothetical protein K0M31_004298 [Melipona bicolor]|uniref:Uncharacterized protein n=1 Tax=Melipona bicolor TaxID=60889 RepID=A0AA40FWM8_9HYME|nr:hypothetical protein K0M31_004298 [Melipona bicolor]